MIGKILDYNNEFKSGLIRGEDGNKYRFSIDDCKSTITPKSGAEVDFEPNGDKAVEVYVMTKDTVDDIKDVTSSVAVKEFTEISNTKMTDSENKSKWSPWLLAFFPAIWVITELVFTHQGVIMLETVAEAFGAAIALAALPFLITFIIFIKKKAQDFAYVNFVKDTVMAMIAMSILHVFVIINDRRMETSLLPQSENIEVTTTNDAPSSEEVSSSLGDIDTEVGIMFPLDIFIVNLLSESGRRYLKVEMNLELESEELALKLKSKNEVLRDVIIRILSGKSLEEVSTIKGKEAIKEQIVSELNTRVKDGKIKNVYFVDFVVQ